MTAKFARVVAGRYHGYAGDVAGTEAGTVTVLLSVLGEDTAEQFLEAELELGDDLPAQLYQQRESADRLAKLRRRIAEEYDELADLIADDYFLELAGEPPGEPVAEWDEYAARYEAAKRLSRDQRIEASREFDRCFAMLPAGQVKQAMEQDPERWLPATALRNRRSARYPDLYRSPADLEEQLLDRLFAGKDIDRSRTRGERAEQLRLAAARAAYLRYYREWAAEVWPLARRDADRDAALARVSETRDAAKARFRSDFGMELPDSIFRFQAFIRSLPEQAKTAIEDLELYPEPTLRLLEDPDWEPDDGTDPRADHRYYRDPPEFVPFMQGWMDGLHAGLWFDDGVRCSGVAAYYHSDGGGVGLPVPTPLRWLRDVLESSWIHVEKGPAKVGRPDPEQVEWRHRKRLLREAIMIFETGEFPQHGDDYREAVADPDRYTGDPNRVETLDGAGVDVEAPTDIPRGPQKPWGEYDFYVALKEELTDPASRAARVAVAKQRCTTGNPGDLLALGRDLHYISAADPRLEREAAELLTLAYRALGRDSLAELTQVHYRKRQEWQTTRRR